MEIRTVQVSVSVTTINRKLPTVNTDSCCSSCSTQTGRVWRRKGTDPSGGGDMVWACMSANYIWVYLGQDLTG